MVRLRVRDVEAVQGSGGGEANPSDTNTTSLVFGSCADGGLPASQSCARPRPMEKGRGGSDALWSKAAVC